jgi:trehalose-phosphatase
VTEPRALLAALRDRLTRRPLVLLLDVDGTLSPIAPTPESATVPDSTRAALRRLAAESRVHVALVSGRAAQDARRLVGVDGIRAIGNHGFETVTPDGELVSDPAIAPYGDAVESAVSAIEPLLRAHDGTRLEDKRWTLSIHYRAAAEGVGDLLRRELEPIAMSHGLRMTAGKKVFELRPPVEVNKGTACVALLDELLAGSDGVALYAGDDMTDEDAFRALRASRYHTITVRIAPGNEEAPIESSAEFTLPAVEAMGTFLQLLAREAERPRVANTDG